MGWASVTLHCRTLKIIRSMPSAAQPATRKTLSAIFTPTEHHPPSTRPPSTTQPLPALTECSKPYPSHQGSYRASATWKVLPRKCCSVLWVPTPAVSGLQSPSLLSQSVPRGMHEPFPDHHGTSGHPETCPGLSNPPREDRTIQVTIFLGRDGSNRQRAAPATLAHPGAHQQQFISSCGSRFFHFFH